MYRRFMPIIILLKHCSGIKMASDWCKTKANNGGKVMIKWLKVFSLCFIFWSRAGHSFAQQTPNIIIIYVDDMGYGDLSSYGSEIPTPNIDRIGKEGIRFTEFYTASPVCTPSRFSLLTGQYPQRSKHRLTFALMPGDKNHLDTSEHTLARYLKQVHYRTGLVGKWHLGMADSTARLIPFGFDYFSGLLGGCIDYFQHNYGSMGPDWYINNLPAKENGYATDLLTSHAISFIQSGRKQQPFFLYLAYNAPHYGKTDSTQVHSYTISLGKARYKGYEDMNTLQAPEKYLKRFSVIADPYRRVYAAMVASLDDNIGRLLAYLKKENLLHNTMIWFMSDNGGYSRTHFSHASNGPLRGEKAGLYEGGIRVPAMVMWQKKIKAGQVLDGPVCNIDLVPTIATITGFSHDLALAEVDGVNIGPLLFKQQPINRSLYWRFGKQTACRQGDWKLVNGKELYNLKKDREEKHDRARQYPHIVGRLASESNRVLQND